MEINPAETSEAPNDAASRERTGEPPNRRGAASGVHTSGEQLRLLVQSVKDYAILMLDPEIGRAHV